MLYFEQLPPPDLRPYVDKLWYCRARDFANRTRTLPLLHHELIFNFSDYFAIFRHEGQNPVLQNASAWIGGLQTSPTTSVSAGNHEMMGVLFKPHGLAAFTTYPAAEFENLFVDAAAVFGDSLPPLLEQVHAAVQPESKLALIYTYLRNRRRVSNTMRYVTASLQLFDAGADSRHCIRDVCRQLGVTNKTLIRSYQKQVGVTPVKYLQLQALNEALATLAKNPEQRLTDLAYRLHFFDQSHFIHSFKTFTGLTPTQYAHLAANSRVDPAAANFIVCAG